MSPIRVCFPPSPSRTTHSSASPTPPPTTASPPRSTPSPTTPSPTPRKHLLRHRQRFLLSFPPHPRGPSPIRHEVSVTTALMVLSSPLPPIASGNACGGGEDSRGPHHHGKGEASRRPYPCLSIRDKISCGPNLGHAGTLSAPTRTTSPAHPTGARDTEFLLSLPLLPAAFQGDRHPYGTRFLLQPPWCFSTLHPAAAVLGRAREVGVRHMVTSFEFAPGTNLVLKTWMRGRRPKLNAITSGCSEAHFLYHAGLYCSDDIGLSSDGLEPKCEMEWAITPHCP